MTTDKTNYDTDAADDKAEQPDAWHKIGDVAARLVEKAKEARK